MKRLAEIILLKLIMLLFLFGGVTFLCFSMLNLIPGDVAYVMLEQQGEKPTDEAVSDFRRRAGMDRSFTTRYILWAGRVIRFDFGVSLRTGEKVSDMIRRTLPATAELASFAFLLVVAVSAAAGVSSAMLRSGRFDVFLFFSTVGLSSVPVFILGPLMVYFFSMTLNITPLSGRGGVMNLILPVLTLGMGTALIYGRVLSAATREILMKSYITTAMAKGLSWNRVVISHALKNALAPAVTMWGVAFGSLMSGSVVVENVFAWPGMGRLTVDAIFNRDYPVVMACIMSGAMFSIFANYLAEIIIRYISPWIE